MLRDEPQAQRINGNGTPPSHLNPLDRSSYAAGVHAAAPKENLRENVNGFGDLPSRRSEPCNF